MKRHVMWIAMAGMVVAAVGATAQERVRVANEGTIGDKWMLAEGTILQTPAYPAGQVRRGDDVCVALGYRIEPDGTTSDFHVLKQWSSASGEKEPVAGYWESYAGAAADAVAQWRFQPRPGTGEPVPTLTVATLGFNGKADAGGDIGANCRIANLGNRLAELGIDRFGDRIAFRTRQNDLRQQANRRMNEEARNRFPPPAPAPAPRPQQ